MVSRTSRARPCSDRNSSARSAGLDKRAVEKREGQHRQQLTEAGRQHPHPVEVTDMTKTRLMLDLSE